MSYTPFLLSYFGVIIGEYAENDISSCSAASLMFATLSSLGSLYSKEMREVKYLTWANPAFSDQSTPHVVVYCTV